jgi:uncharacterized protein (TIGR02099 family)
MKRIRIIKHSFHLTRWLLAVLIILTMAFLIAGRMFVSYIEDSTAEAVAQLSDILGVPVSVTSVDTDWHGLGPSLILNDVVLGEGDERSTLSMLSVKPDVLSSLKNLSLVWSRFQVSGLELKVDELASGHWQVAGIAVEAGSGGSSFVEKMLLDSRLVSVSDTRVHITSLNGTSVSLRMHDLSLVNSLGFHRLSLEADFGSDENQLYFIAELNGAAVRFSQLDGLAYLKIAGEDASGFYNFFREKFWPEVDSELAATPRMTADFWATLRANEEIQIQGELLFDQIPGSIIGLDSGQIEARSTLVAAYSEERLQADLLNPVIRMSDDEIVLPNLRLSRQISGQQVSYGMQLPSLDVGRLIESAAEIGIVQESLLDQLSALELQGLIERFYLEVPAGSPQDWSVTADLKSFGMNSFKRAPAVRNLTGRLGIDHLGGRVEVDSTEFSILYPQAYDHWLAHQSIKGMVAWEIDTEDRFVHVYSDYIEAESVQGSVIGAFAADVPMFPDHPTGVGLTLYLGLTDSGVEHTSSLLPDRLPQSLKDWLGQSLVAGQVPQAGMIYRGSTRPGTEKHRTVQLHIQTDQAELNFLPQWPNLIEAKADVWVSNTDVYARSSSAKILDLDLGTTDVWVNAPATLQEVGNSANRQLRIQSHAQGPANSALDLIRTTNLRDQIGEGLDDLDLLGEASAEISLILPITENIQRKEIQADIEVSLSGNQLNIAPLDLSLTGIEGMFHYDQAGLHSESLNAFIWDSPLILEIREDIDNSLVHVTGEGDLEAKSIVDWLGFGLLESVQGVSTVTGDLQISTDASAQEPHVFEFKSDMTEVVSELPAPLAKPPGLPAPLSVRLEKTRGILTRINWQLPDIYDHAEATLVQLETVFETGFNELQAARFSYGADLPMPEAGVAKGRVLLPQLDLAPWIELMGGGGGSDTVPGAETFGGLSPELDFEVDDLSIGTAGFDQVTGLLSYLDDAWNIGLETAYASGTYRSFTDGQTLPKLDLSYIDINAYLETFDADSRQQQPADDVMDPRELPEMQFDLHSTIYDGKNRGRWSGEFRPTDTGLLITNLEGGLGSAMLSQDEGQSTFFWGIDIYGQYTEANFTFEYEDIGDLFKILDMTPPLNSSEGLFYASLYWQGSPFEYSDSELNGIMGVDASNGEFFTSNNNVNPLMKTIGLFNAGAWTRRLRLDFKDVTAEGTYFDRLVGDFVLEENRVTTLTPVTVNMSSGSLMFDGEIDLDLEIVEAKLVVTLPARQNMTWVTALVGGLPAAAGVWLASKIFDVELDSLSSVSYRVSGPVDDPEVVAVRAFDSTITD